MRALLVWVLLALANVSVGPKPARDVTDDLKERLTAKAKGAQSGV